MSRRYAVAVMMMLNLLMPQSIALGQSGWLPVQSVPPIPGGCVLFSAVDMLDSLRAVLVGQRGVIWGTSDGGLNWAAQPSGTSAWLVAVDFTVVSTGTVVGEGGVILRTTDAGTSWVAQISGTTQSLEAVCFSDANHGVVVGRAGTLLTTSNGGVRWTSVDLGPALGFNLWAVTSITPNIWIVVGDNGTTLRSTDGGATWKYTQFCGTGGCLAFREVSHTGGSEAVALTEDPRFLLRTTNAGASWVEQPLDITFCPFYEVSFLNPWHGTIVGGIHSDPACHGWVVHTTDAGQTWVRQLLPFSCVVLDVSIATQRHGIIVGYTYNSSLTSFWPMILITVTGGDPVGVYDNDKGDIPMSFALSQNYPNPFNPSTTIRYGLPSRSHVTLIVFNTLGQQVATLVEGEQEAGYHEAVFDASGLASGVYLYRLRSASELLVQKMLYIR